MGLADRLRRALGLPDSEHPEHEPDPVHGPTGSPGPAERAAARRQPEDDLEHYASATGTFEPADVALLPPDDAPSTVPDDDPDNDPAPPATSTPGPAEPPPADDPTPADEPPPADRVRPFVPAVVPELTAPTAAPAPQPPPEDHPAPAEPPFWLPEGVAVHFAGHTLEGGLLYLGRAGAPGTGHVIDPTLPVGPSAEATGRDPDPAYHAMTPRDRAAHLRWLATGRRDRAVPIGHVFLFLAGLEHRVVADRARADLPAVRAELRDLRSRYGRHRPFHGSATALLDLVDVLLDDRPLPDPARWDRPDPPLALRVALGELAAAGQPVPVEWAHAWALLHPALDAPRARARFRELFTARYHERHGEGLLINPAAPPLTVRYRPTAEGIPTAEVPTDLPDVLTTPAPTRALAELLDTCADELDAHAALLADDPDAEGTPPALALLPSCVVTGGEPALDPFRALVSRVLPEGAALGVFELADLVALWPGGFDGTGAIGAPALLGHLGVGLEPDARTGLEDPRATGPAALFRVPDGDELPHAATPEYRAASTLLRLAAQGEGLSEPERVDLTAHLGTALRLTGGEVARLNAHAVLLLTPGAPTPPQRLGGLTLGQRVHIADLAAGAARVDTAPPGVDQVFRRMRAALDPSEPTPEPLPAPEPTSELPPAPEPEATPALDAPTPDADPAPALEAPPEPAEVVEVQLLEPSPDAEAVPTVLPAAAEVPALLELTTVDLSPEPPAALPPSPSPAEPPTTPSPVPDPRQEPADPTTSHLHAALAEDDPTTPPPRSAVLPVDLVPGLDAGHSALLRELAARPVWPRAEFDRRCAALHLLPIGALDALNEAAVAACGEPVAEPGEHGLLVNDTALGELLA
ncbi:MULTISPECIES: TerB N-terminal domain-containing protein [Actinosynnema]|uniref:TerB N-terminal domain-containing protein n=1 Tax=Actinosynnema TaxID=40566 RepID=UPI0020A275CB|nr:TerB N-terminal domain-containing protein [Actinosynnema pretiosum]MCP2092443.1 TerB-C domain-containing protein [Actinosynnema pretiosum]